MSRITEIENDIKKLQEELDYLKSLPKDIYPIGTVILSTLPKYINTPSYLQFARKEDKGKWDLYAKHDEVDTLADVLVKSMSMSRLETIERIKLHD